MKGTEGSAENSDLESFSSGQVQNFLDQLIMAEPLSLESVAKMDAAYSKISSSKNSEIRFRWLRVCIKAKYEKCIDNALAMVTEQGRMKFTRPLYRDLYNWETAREKTVANFKGGFHILNFSTHKLYIQVYIII